MPKLQSNEMNAQAIGSGSKESEIWAWRFYLSRLDRGFKALPPVKLMGSWTVNWQYTDPQQELPFPSQYFYSIDTYRPIEPCGH